MTTLLKSLFTCTSHRTTNIAGGVASAQAPGLVVDMTPPLPVVVSIAPAPWLDFEAGTHLEWAADDNNTFVSWKFDDPESIIKTCTVSLHDGDDPTIVIRQQNDAPLKYGASGAMVVTFYGWTNMGLINGQKLIGKVSCRNGFGLIAEAQSPISTVCGRSFLDVHSQCYTDCDKQIEIRRCICT